MTGVEWPWPRKFRMYMLTATLNAVYMMFALISPIIQGNIDILK